MKHKRFYAKLITVVLLVCLLVPAMAANGSEPSWAALAPMSDPRMNFQTEVVDGQIYAIGGLNPSYQTLSSIEVYNTETNTWTTLSSMPIAKMSFETEVIDGKIYVIGGRDENWEDLLSAEVYDPATDTWTAIAFMSSAQAGFQTEVIDGKIYAIGGTIDDTSISSVEVYDPAVNTWTALTSMLTPRSSFQTAVLDGKIYAIGGWDANGEQLLSAEVYDPSTDTWTVLASMATEQPNCVTAVVDGKIYIIGGNDTAAVEVYNPNTDTWTTLSSMPIAKIRAGNAIMDGKIYIIGGKNEEGSGELASTEVYDPVTDTWMTLSPLVLPRENVQAEVINATIYAIGGSYEGAGLPIAEKYPDTSGGGSYVPDAPTNLTTTAGDAQIDLAWDPVSGATSYTVMRATVSGGPYTAIAPGVTTTSYTDTDVSNGSTYYYVVTAVCESGYSTDASATPTGATPDYNSQLRITMATGEIKEYEMDNAEVEYFVSWCDSEGTGSPVYVIEKDYNIGPFSARTEYIVYDKISSFEVLQY